MASILFSNGLVVMLEACIFFTVFDSLTKYLVDSFTMGEIAFVRFGFGALMMFPMFLRERSAINRNDFFYLVLRGLLGVAGFYSTILAFQTGALSVTMVLFFTSPLWALFMGALFLKETVTLERIVCIIAAICGITVLIRPWGEGIAFSHFYGLVAGMMGGANSVVTRYLRARHHSRVIYAFQCFVGVLFSIPFIIGRTRMPELTSGMVLLIAAIFGLLGQVTMNYGFRFIRAAEGTILLMVEAILTAIVGITLFDEPLTFTFVAGTVMILGSGIYLGLRTGKETIGAD